MIFVEYKLLPSPAVSVFNKPFSGLDVVMKNRDNTLCHRAQEYKKQQSLVSVTVCPALVCDHVPH
jgi:hypothetical protein